MNQDTSLSTPQGDVLGSGSARLGVALTVTLIIVLGFTAIASAQSNVTIATTQSNVRIYQEDGALGWNQLDAFGAGLTTGIDAGDLDGDGDPDLALAHDKVSQTSGFDAYCLNDGGGSFTCFNLPRWKTIGGVPATPNAWDVEIAELDGQPGLDMIFAGGTSQTAGAFLESTICTNDGNNPPTFTCSQFGTRLDNKRGVAAEDFDGDGDVDIAFVNIHTADGYSEELCLNDGAGNFSCAAFPALFNVSGTIETADLDGDSDMDVLLHAWTTTEQICLNDGSAGFTCSAAPGSNAPFTTFAVLGDFDGDTDLDFMAQSGNKVCFNDGSGSFTCTTNAFPALFPEYHAMAVDIDSDGDIDVVTAMGRTCLNDGSGAFSCTTGSFSGSGFDIILAEFIPPPTPTPTPTLTPVPTITPTPTETPIAPPPAQCITDFSFNGGIHTMVQRQLSILASQANMQLAHADTLPPAQAQYVRDSVRRILDNWILRLIPLFTAQGRISAAVSPLLTACFQDVRNDIP